jgi:hypothetical protein
MRKTMTRAPKIWKMIFRIKKRINPRKAASVRTTRIREPVKKSLIMWAISYPSQVIGDRSFISPLPLFQDIVFEADCS